MRFREIHGEKYGYDDLNYSGMKYKVTIVCPVHGLFKQIAGQHLRGDGCQRCSGRHRWSTEEFIENSKLVHGDRFTYEKTEYVKALSSVTITCRVHGDFSSQPSRHIIKKHGCAKCSPSSEKSIDHFLAKSAERFGNRYDYSLVEYVDTKTPVKIICSTHGVFEQPPVWHLNSAVGCQQCSYNVSSKETAWIDSLNLPSTAKRQAKVMIGGRRRNVDAFDPVSGKVYEFWGCWWHGCKTHFPPDGVHHKCKKTFGDLYKETLAKRRAIKKAGYTLVEIWEHDFDLLVKAGIVSAPTNAGMKTSPWSEDEQKLHSMTEDQWLMIKPMLHDRVCRGLPVREFFNAAVCRARLGASWRSLPLKFGKWETACSRFSVFKRNKTLMKVFWEIVKCHPANPVDLV